MSADLERWRSFADQAGVLYRMGTADDFPPANPDVATVILVEAKAGPKNTGYRGFVARITFDTDGNLIEFGVWE